MATENFLIWMERYAPNGWYRPNSGGYTNDVVEAGRFTEESAQQHSRSRSGDCIAVKYGSEEMEKILRRVNYMGWKLYKIAKALEVYADEDHWAFYDGWHPTNEIMPEFDPDRDPGELARAAIKEVYEPEGKS